MKRSLHDVRVGVIGAGFIGPVHVEALRRLGVRVSALCDVPGVVNAAASRLGIPKAYGDHRQLVADPEVDVVHIASPNRWHEAMALAALEAGRHVVCEKPLAMTTRQTARLVREVEARPRQIFAVNYNCRFYPAVLQMRELVRSGELGRVIHVNGSYFQDWLFKETDYNWRLLPAEGGALRAVADIGTHWLDLVSFVIGARVRAVMADLLTFHSVRRRPLGEVQTFARAAGRVRTAPYQVKTEDCGSVLLEFENGARGNLAVSQVAAGRKNCLRVEIYGSKQSVWWCSEDPEMLHLGRRDEPNASAVRATPAFGRGAAGYMDHPPGHVEGFPDTFKMNFRAIYSAILDGPPAEPLYATVRDGHEEVAVCEAIRRSAAVRRWVAVRRHEFPVERRRS
ncbi:MAG: Gfo/Idh/MocA family oxidoreductase [Kiritimatiellae bacterium]|nr:Gfo/Idh/MocA family oxidoreductase [Kiritimatiellia bacterium]